MDIENYSLEKLARAHLSKLGRIIDDLSVLQYRTIPQNLAFLLEVNENLFGVFVLDWVRPIGTNQLIKFEQIVENSNLAMALMVGTRFSSNTRELAERTKRVMLISRAEIIDAFED